MLWITAAALPSASTAQLNVVSPAGARDGERGRGRAGAVEPRGALGEVRRVEQAVERDVAEGRVAEVAVAVLERERGRAHDDVDVRRRVVGQRGDVDVLEHPEDLQAGEALGVRRRRDGGAAAVARRGRARPSRSGGRRSPRRSGRRRARARYAPIAAAISPS